MLRTQMASVRGSARRTAMPHRAAATSGARMRHGGTARSQGRSARPAPDRATGRAPGPGPRQAAPRSPAPPRNRAAADPGAPLPSTVRASVSHRAGCQRDRRARPSARKSARPARKRGARPTAGTKRRFRATRSPLAPAWRLENCPARSSRAMKNGRPRWPTRCSVVRRWASCSNPTPKRRWTMPRS